jgi:hypothetical protein
VVPFSMPSKDDGDAKATHGATHAVIDALSKANSRAGRKCGVKSENRWSACM